MNKVLKLSVIVLLLASCGVKKKNDESKITFIESPAKTPSQVPNLFTDESGLTYLSWVEEHDNKSEFKFSKLTDNKWSAPILIDSGTTWVVNWADYPMTASLGKNIIAHYLDQGGTNPEAYDIKFTVSSDEGKSWLKSRLLHDDGKQAEHGFVSLLPYGENFFVAWLDGRNTVMEGMEHHEGHHGQMSLRAAVISKEGKKLNEWELDNRTCDCCQTSAAMTNNGPVVIYRDRSDEEIRDMSIVRYVNGEWTKPKSIHDDKWKIAGCPVNGPRVVTNKSTMAVAWFSVPDGKAQVNVIFSNDGGETFGKPTQVDEGKPIGRVDIVLLDDKSVMVSWMEGTTIKAIKVNNDGSKGQSLTIASSSESRSSGFPQMAKSGDKLIFAWTDDKDKIVKTAFITL